MQARRGVDFERAMPLALAFPFFCLPLFPGFIMLTTTSVPGISLISLPVTVAIMGAALLVALYAVFMLLRPPRVASPILLPVLAWCGAGILAVALGFNPHDGAIFALVFGMGVIWHSALIRYYPLAGSARSIAWALLLSGALAALAAVVMVVLRQPAAQFTIGHGRAIGTFVLPGELAGYLIVFLPIAYAFTRIARERALCVLAWIALAVGAVAFLLTFSRTGWVGLAAAIGFFVVLRARRRGIAVLVALAIVAAVLAALLFVFNIDHNPSENFTRLSIWQTALQIIDRFPLTGVGPFGFSHLYAILRQPDGDATAFHPHSIYLMVLAQMGVIGLAGFTWMWVSFARRLREALRSASAAGSLLALAIAAGLFGTLVQGLIDVVSVVIFGLWFPMLAYALVAARHGLGEPPA